MRCGLSRPFCAAEARSFAEQIQVRVEESGSGIMVRTEYPKTWTRRNISYSVNYEITMPETAPLELRNRFGAVTVQNLQVEVTQIAEQYFQKYRSVKKDRADYLQSLAQQAQAGSHHDIQPLPKQYQHILQYCPVKGTTYFSDGFGAPRYAGGYHLHAGVDLVTARGTPIVAPFDGVARTSYNTLGGNAVYVTGQDGYSLLMAIGFIVAIGAYFAEVYTLRLS